MRNPADYLAEVEAKHPGVLQSQWIPTDPTLWQVDRYADFLAARRGMSVTTAASVAGLRLTVPGNAECSCEHPNVIAGS
jgi:hypothetical protein